MRLRSWLFLWGILTLAGTCLAATPPPPPPPAPISSEAEKIYSDARERLLQIRTLVINTGQQSTLGSGFFVSADGLAITNYHVVSQYAVDPQTYNLQYAAPDGSSGALTLIAVDVVNDLALLRADTGGRKFFEFEPIPSSPQSLKGKRLFALGNPLDIGFTIVEGTYNGLVDHSYNERIHFTGAINAGMSGGPAVTAGGKVVGINVAKSVNNELVSFLVPAKFAVALLDRARAGKPLVLANTRQDIGRQLDGWQSGLYGMLLQQSANYAIYGSYKVLDGKMPWFNCWSSTNAGDTPKPLAVQNTTSCLLETDLFFENDLRTGVINISYTYAKNGSLNKFQFSKFVERYHSISPLDDYKGQYYTKRYCHENFIAPDPAGHRPPLEAVWCAQAYRDYDDITDVSLTAVTQDSDSEALIARISMKGVSYGNALAMADRFLGAIQWNR
jgi:hypothetical protein